MFGWAIFFLLIALVAAFFGFGGIADLSADFAVIILIVALVLAVVTGVLGWRGRGRM
ncbi:hypothetical protein GCM10007972_22680 [Iodidimonas muriae]|uniref:UPF0391 membrane protein GCM10007972_22680 n=1 Tax=Iodidimonas muriae TaxID=261467 RepID=A0ABQ2LH95_9PROT|nr:DUF1328 domain-containing protein [Iodidimonas muriae]GGO14984.1 hypothetical protein GCM10007972_22680 [Iodidimonas muriae]